MLQTFNIFKDTYTHNLSPYSIHIYNISKKESKNSIALFCRLFSTISLLCYSSIIIISLLLFCILFSFLPVEPPVYR